MLALVGCGVVYTSPSVQQQAAGVDVRVVGLTFDTVQIANRAAYNPKQLPSYFYATAGGGDLTELPDFPDAPFIPDETPQPVQLSVPPTVDTGPYRIGVGDVVILSTKTNDGSIEQLTGLLAAQNQREGYTVRDDGAISVPDVGSVQIVGLTIQEAEDRLFDVLLQNQIEPSFSLEVSEFNSQRVVVGGDVQSDVVLPLQLDDVTLAEAIAATGGITIRDREFGVISIYRDGQIYDIPYLSYLERGSLQRLNLVNGDAIFVSTSYDLDRAIEFYREYLNVISLESGTRKDVLEELQIAVDLRRSSLNERRDNFELREELGAHERDYVYLTGEVIEQSRFEMPYNVQVSLADVIYDGAEGIPTVTGDLSQIYVLRASPTTGALTAWHLDARNAANFAIATRMQMRPNDVVFVEEQVITKWSRALAQFLPALITFGTAALVGAVN